MEFDAEMNIKFEQRSMYLGEINASLECNLYDHSSVAELSNRIRQLLTVIL
jgi:hypothetical protein